MRLIVTMGDPRGIGPDVILMTAARKNGFKGKVIGSRDVFTQRASTLGLEDVLERLDVEEPPGMPEDPLSEPGRAAIACLDHATAMMAQTPGALVTAPINKEAMHEAGFSFPGHTEYLAHRAGGVRVHMMMASPRLNVVLVTIHEPLRIVPDLVTRDRVLDTLRAAAGTMRDDFGIPEPVIGVAGLNPHAGEGGMFGTEELEVIGPAVEQARSEMPWATFIGPRPPDTVFFEALERSYDVVVAMYHDQGLGPVKALAFHETVNVTLGLPYVRTSPDHGTAFDLAGTGRANPSSFMAACDLALRMARNRFS